MANEIQPIPSDVSDLQRLVESLNDRFRRINAALTVPLRLTGDIDASGFRITNLGSPQALNDAVNRASLPARGTGGQAATPGVNTTRIITETRVAGGTAAASIFTNRPAQLTANLNITEAETPTNSKLLVVVVQQGAAAAWAVTFDAGDFSAVPTNISPELDSYTTWMFIGNTATGLWDLATNALTEWTP